MKKLKSLSSSGHIPIIDAFVNLKHIRGDVVSAILFLPVALMVQSIAGELFSPEEPLTLTYFDFGLNALKLTFIIYISTMEVLSIIIVLINWGLASIYQRSVVGLSVLIFSTATILMGYTKDTQFKFAFIFSLIAAFWGLLLLKLFDWDGYFAAFREDKARRMIPFIIIMFVIGSVIFILASPPLK